jgi:SM-20-related protein
MVTTVLYLNPDWQAEWGGELVIYGEDSDEKLAVITPEMGKLVVFMSEQIPHEVLPTRKPRASIAGWFRCNASVTGKIDPAR